MTPTLTQQEARVLLALGREDDTNLTDLVREIETLKRSEVDTALISLKAKRLARKIGTGRDDGWVATSKGYTLAREVD